MKHSGDMIVDMRLDHLADRMPHTAHLLRKVVIE